MEEYGQESIEFLCASIANAVFERPVPTEVAAAEKNAEEAAAAAAA